MLFHFPRYLQLLMLFSVHVFVREGVDVAIYETHNGGEYDATNVIPEPVATGISTIGMDHVAHLGPSIQNIAWHKAGIFKRGSIAISTTQEPAAAGMLQLRANQKGVALEFVDIHPVLPPDARAPKQEVQIINSSLAIALTNAFLSKQGPKKHRSLNPEDIARGIENFFWPGSFHQINNRNHQWFIDIADNHL